MMKRLLSFSYKIGKANMHAKTKCPPVSPPLYRCPTIDELPVPKGDWLTAYRKKQKFCNTVLGTGMLAFFTTFYWLNKTVYFAFSPRSWDICP